MTSTAGVRFAHKLIQLALPVGAGWFSQLALKSGEIGKLIRALSKPVGQLLDAAYQAEHGLFLDEATGEYLKAWAADFGVETLPGDTDEVLRARIVREAYRSRNARLAIEELVSGRLQTTCTIFEPWRHVMTYDGGQGWGDDARYSSAYYTGGVVDVFTGEHSSQTRSLVREALAAGVLPYFHAELGEELEDPVVDPLERSLDPMFTRGIELGTLLGTRDDLEYGKTWPYAGITPVQPGMSLLIQSECRRQAAIPSSGYAPLLSVYTWQDLASKTYEEWAARGYYDELDAEITQEQLVTPPDPDGDPGTASATGDLVYDYHLLRGSPNTSIYDYSNSQQLDRYQGYVAVPCTGGEDGLIVLMGYDGTHEYIMPPNMPAAPNATGLAMWGDYVFVACANAGKLVRYDRATGEGLVITPPESLSALAVDADYLYAVNGWGNKIYRMAHDGTGAMGISDTSGLYLYALRERNGFLYSLRLVGDATHAELVKMPVSGGVWTRVSLIYAPVGQDGFDVDVDENLYMSHASANIYRYPAGHDYTDAGSPAMVTTAVNIANGHQIKHIRYVAGVLFLTTHWGELYRAQLP